MILQAFGALAAVVAAFVFAIWLARRDGIKYGYELHRTEMAEHRAQRRAEARIPRGRHHALAPFPDREAMERPPTDTGELRALAETGDIDGIKRLNAAFFRVLDLKRWTRAA